MRSSLFLKIFLWFWLAMTVVAGALVISGEMNRASPQFSPFREFTRNAMSFARRSTQVLERGGLPALEEYLEQLERSSRIRVVVFDPRGREVSGRTALPGAEALAARALRSSRVEVQPEGRMLLVAQSARAPGGEGYTVVGQIPGPRFGRGVQPAALALRLLVVVVTGGVVCYGLARYLTSPVARLQKATQQLAGGDLTARVGSVLAKRGDEFSDLGHDFDLMAERIERLINSQRRLLSDISHELRSPLARLNVALELARKRAGSEAGASLDRIEREAGRMNDLISQLLGLARWDSDAESRQEESISLADLVQEVAADADYEATSQNRRVSVLESEDCIVTGSPELLRSAIENIVRNGLHYTAKDTRVEVRLSISRIDDRAYAVVVVRDHGPGVPEGALKELFRPFYRVEEARDRLSGGSGLGLAIAERIIRLHGGAVTATNASEKGLQVEIRIPLRKGDEGQA
ncbi:MAG: HAMP domain-containing protein [Acidobacteria bacterium]|nr:MAG: HAMP domain-containing protein [Acidobacteriota bacterium]